MADGQVYRLSTYLLEQTGIQLSGKQISRILQKKNYVYIWGAGMPKQSTLSGNSASKYSLEAKQNKADRAIFREKLETYLKAGQVAPELFQVWFWDETGFSLRVIRRKCWTLFVFTGKKCQVSGAESE